MSYAGDSFKYDVFFSYAHGVEALRGQLDMREWSRRVIDRVGEFVVMSLAEEAGGENVDWYLDRDKSVTGEPLTESLESAVKDSAILVVLMSPQYHKSWAYKELKWYFENAKKDGRGLRQCVLLEIQRTPDAAWPEELRDSAGERLLSQRLYDENGLPIGFEEFTETGKLSFTGGLLTRMAVEIKDKLLDLRKRLRAQQAMAEILGQELPDDLLIYLDAELQDEKTWQSRRQTLAGSNAVVLPDGPSESEMVERSDNMLSVYKDCDGLVLHRVRKDDLVAVRVRRAYQDRKTLLQKKKFIPWAILDELPDCPLPSATTFRIPRVVTSEEDWPDRLFKALGGVPEPEAAR